VNERIKDATRGISGIRPVLGIIKKAASETGNVQMVLDDFDMWTAMLRPLKAFNSVAGRIGDVHTFISIESVVDLHVDPSLFERSSDYIDCLISGALISISSA